MNVFRVILIAATTLVAATLLPAAASAAIPACTSYTNPNGFEVTPTISTPSELTGPIFSPIGATRNFKTSTAYFFTTSGSISISLEAAPGGAIAHPWSTAVTYSGLSGEFPVRLDAGDSAARLRFDGPVKGQVGATYQECMGTFYSRNIEPASPDQFISEKPESINFRGNYDNSGVRFSADVGGCGDGVLSLTFRSKGSSRNLTSGPGCIFAKPGKFTALGFTNGFIKVLDEDELETVVDLSSTTNKRFKKTIKYKTSFNGIQIHSGRFTLARRYDPGYKGYRIWSDTDDYWNVCVNDGRTTWASNGRFYCWEPGVSPSWATKLIKVS